MSAYPVRQPDRSVKARQVQAVPLPVLNRVLAALQRPEPPSGALVPAGPPRREVPRTADELPRVPGYPKPNALDPHASRYAATMRRVNLATGTTGLGDYWQQPGVFTVGRDGSGCFWQGPATFTAGGAR